MVNYTKTLEGMQLPTPSASLEASAPLTFNTLLTSTSSVCLRLNESPRSTATLSEMELPRNPVSAKRTGVAI